MKYSYLLFLTISFAFISCKEAKKEQDQEVYYSLFESKNFKIIGDSLHFEKCKKNSFEIESQISYKIEDKIVKKDTITYIIYSELNISWFMIRFVEVKKGLNQLYNTGVYNSKSELLKETKEHPFNSFTTNDYIDFFSRVKPNRTIIDEIILDNYTDLRGNSYSFTESKFGAKINLLDDFTGKEIIKEVEYDIIDRFPFGHWFCCLLKNDSGYNFIIYRLKTDNTALLFLYSNNEHSFVKVDEFLSYWLDKGKVPSAVVIMKD